MEAQFTTRNSTNEWTRFDHVVASLPLEFATEVRYLLTRTTREGHVFHSEDPADSAYSHLGATAPPTTLHYGRTRRLEAVPAASQDAATPHATPRTPSCESSFYSTYQAMCMVLASSGEITLEALARLADKVMEVSSPSISTVSVAPLTLKVEQLREEVGQLCNLIATLLVSQPQSESGSN